MRAGTTALQEVVRQICKLMVEHDVQIGWQWMPRETPELALADYYSKEVDTGEPRNFWCPLA